MAKNILTTFSTGDKIQAEVIEDEGLFNKECNFRVIHDNKAGYLSASDFLSEFFNFLFGLKKGVYNIELVKVADDV
jgi:hypothetical protein